MYWLILSTFIIEKIISKYKLSYVFASVCYTKKFFINLEKYPQQLPISFSFLISLSTNPQNRLIFPQNPDLKIEPTSQPFQQCHKIFTIAQNYCFGEIFYEIVEIFADSVVYFYGLCELWGWGFLGFLRR